jgi:hypothetical protein
MSFATEHVCNDKKYIHVFEEDTLQSKEKEDICLFGCKMKFYFIE